MDYYSIPFDKITIPQSKLDVEGSRRVNALPWRGQFTPELLEQLIVTYMNEGLLVDPYCGSGTTLMEAAHAGLPSHGVEVNPAAFILADLYSLCAYPPGYRINGLKSIEEKLRSVGSLLEDAVALAEWCTLLVEPVERKLMEAIFLLTLRNGITSDRAAVSKALAQVRELVHRLPAYEIESKVELGDARNISLSDCSASMIVTSPPYVNVFNYHQNYRKAVELLGCDVLPAARAEFGSNRKHRQNRFLTVIQYAQDIGLSLAETARIAKPGALSIWVVGRESNVRGQAVRNPRIVYEMATRAVGLKLINKHERKFRSRYGALVYEDILVFQHPQTMTTPKYMHVVETGRAVGSGVLAGLKAADSIIAAEINSAALSASRVMPSQAPNHASFHTRRSA